MADYIPYGEEWKKVVSKLTKSELLNLFAKVGKEKDKYKEALIKVRDWDDDSDYDDPGQIAIEALNNPVKPTP